MSCPVLPQPQSGGLCGSAGVFSLGGTRSGVFSLGGTRSEVFSLAGARSGDCVTDNGIID